MIGRALGYFDPRLYPYQGQKRGRDTGSCDMRELQESLACGLAFSQSIASPSPHLHSPNQGDETDKMKTCIQKISCMHSDVLLSTNFVSQVMFRSCRRELLMTTLWHQTSCTCPNSTNLLRLPSRGICTLVPQSS